MNYMPDIQRQWDTVQKIYFSCLQKFGLWYDKIQKILASCHVRKKTENGNTTAMSFMQKIFATCWFYVAQQQSSLLSF